MLPPNIAKPKQLLIAIPRYLTWRGNNKARATKAGAAKICDKKIKTSSAKINKITLPDVIIAKNGTANRKIEPLAKSIIFIGPTIFVT